MFLGTESGARFSTTEVCMGEIYRVISRHFENSIICYEFMDCLCILSDVSLNFFLTAERVHDD